MPIKTDTSVAPYHDDTNPADNYYKIMFKPSMAVQVRELNSLQTLLQNQIEKFGNNIFKRGTIIDGCNFAFYDDYPYIKINDLQQDGLTVIPANYLGFLVKNANNLIATVINSADGFESTDPDLKTLYLTYINSGDSGSESTFSSGQILTVYDSNNSIFRVNIDSTGSGYANTDNLVVTPKLVVNVTSGSFGVGDTITDTTTGAASVIVAKSDVTTRTAYANLGGTVSVTSGNNTIIGSSTEFARYFATGQYVALYSNSTTYSLFQINTVTDDTHIVLATAPSFTNSVSTHATVTPSNVLLTVRPTNVALSNKLITEEAWTFSSNNNIQGASVNDTATVLNVLGAGAKALIVTDSVGRIQLTSVTERGSGYTEQPYVTIQTSSGTLASLNAQNYYAKITVATVTDAVGGGYAFGVGEGYIYQKGYFIRVEPQTVVVSKYDRSPNNVIVTFNTTEEIVDSNIDTNLVDNATGSKNAAAPGADRLKLYPVLEVVDADVTNDPEVFTLVAWNGGVPYKQNQRTSYNVILDEIAQRTKDESGDYVVDRFLTTTSSPANTLLSSSSFDVTVDPGTAYIDGYRVQTLGNYTFTVEKAIGTRTSQNSRVSLNYDNYIKVKEVGGLFDFDTAPLVSLYDTAKTFISNTTLISTGNTNPVGSKIGEARIRNMTFLDGTPGTANGIYRMYLFDIKMNAGKNFKNARSVWYDGTSVDGIADLYLEEYDIAASNSTVDVFNPVLYTQNDNLLFKTGFESILNANNIVYSYRTVDDTQTFSNSGILTVSLASLPDVNFPYTGTLSTAQKRDLYVTPTVNIASQSTITSVASVNSSASVVQTTDQVFLTSLKSGDYIQVNSGATTNIRRVQNIANNIYLTVDSPFSFSNTGGAVVRRAWPQYVPIPIFNDEYTANVDNSGDILTINLNQTFNTVNTSNTVIGYIVEKQNAAAATKTAQRDLYVKVYLANNVAGVDGPWSLGVPDIFRLKNVWIGNSSVSESSTEVTDDFYIDHNQTSNYYDLGYLFKNKKSGLVLTEDDYLLVKFDAFTSTAGMHNITSYVSGTLATRLADDNKTLDELKATNSINTLEIPEVYTDDGKYYDLINCVDFRPYVSNTAVLATSVGSATINPSETVSFGSSSLYFPVPDSVLEQDVEYFLPRTDNILLGRDGQISNMLGSYELGVSPPKPKSALILNVLKHPVYPSIAMNPSNTILDIIDKNVANERYSYTRDAARRITTAFTSQDFNEQQPLGYTQKAIGKIDRRLKDVEYYVSLSQVENQIKDKAIPSSISPDINRFKYGFYADTYESEDYLDVDSPEYAASTENNTLLVPYKEVVSMTHANNITNTVPYENHKLISQINATYKKTDCVCPPSSNVIYTSIIKENSNKKKYPDSKPFIETLEVSMSSNTAPVTLYLDMYNGGDGIKIYQNGTLLKTGDDAVQLTDAEGRQLKNEAPFNSKKYGDPGENFSWRDGGSAGNGKVKNGCKITWTHNPSLGTSYKIVVEKTSRFWRYRLDYPVDGNIGNAGCAECPTETPTEIIFNGVLKPDPKSIKGYRIFKKNEVYVKESIYVIEAKGLKPNTVHYFYYNGSAQTNDVNPKKPYRGGWGAQIKTDEQGRVVFKWRFRLNKKHSKFFFKLSTGSKLLELRSADSKSFAKYNMPVEYIKNESTNGEIEAAQLPGNGANEKS